MNTKINDNNIETCSDKCTFCWGDTKEIENHRHCDNCNVDLNGWHELI